MLSRLHADQKCTISGNEESLYRAVENVVRNAIRYTESGSQVEIALKSSSSNGQRCAEIEVSDRGPGIPENQLKPSSAPSTASIMRAAPTPAASAWAWPLPSGRCVCITASWWQSTG